MHYFVWIKVLLKLSVRVVLSLGLPNTESYTLLSLSVETICSEIFNLIDLVKVKLEIGLPSRIWKVQWRFQS